MKKVNALLVLKTRTKKAKDDLNKIASPLLNSLGSQSATCAYIGTQLNLSGQGVYNYVIGKGGDGFVCEAIAEEFKKLKPVKHNG